MVRATGGHDVVLDAIKYVEYCGLSTDDKPTYFGKKEVVVDGAKVERTIALSTGSIFFEVDTGSVYLFDESNGEWISANGGSDGGSDGGSGEPILH